MTDLGTIGGSTYAMSINDSGQVVSWFDRDLNSNTVGGPAFIYSGGVMTELGTIGGRPVEQAYDINTSGQVAASYSPVAGGPTHAVLYSGGVGTDLGTLGGGPSDFSQATAINNSGQVVGVSAAPNGNRHAFLYSGGVMTDLGTLGGSRSRATDINASGQVVGVFQTAAGTDHVFLYSGGAMTDLGGDWGTGRGLNNDSGSPSINNSGQVVVGNSLYSDGRMTHLNDLIDPLSDHWNLDAGDINDSGQIAASFSVLMAGGALLLSPVPVPEPEIYLMMLAGLGLLGMKVRRRNSSLQS